MNCLHLYVAILNWGHGKTMVYHRTNLQCTYEGVSSVRAINFDHSTDSNIPTSDKAVRVVGPHSFCTKELKFSLQLNSVHRPRDSESYSLYSIDLTVLISSKATGNSFKVFVYSDNYSKYDRRQFTN
jgi:hypothetical protein